MNYMEYIAPSVLCLIWIALWYKYDHPKIKEILKEKRLIRELLQELKERRDLNE